MDTLETIRTHRSIRTYKPDPVPQEDLDAILHAATRASTSGNMQTYSIIVTRDPDRRAALWAMHLEQDMVKEAPVLLTFCADWRRMTTWCDLREAEPGFDNFLCFLVGFADAFIAAQNAALAAEAMGYGICYLGSALTSAPEIIEYLHLPPGVVPATAMVLGVPNENPEVRARLPMESIVHDETYRDFDEERITEIYRERETEGWDRYMSDPKLAERIRRSGVKTLAQVYTKVKYTTESSRRFSRSLLEVLRKQDLATNG